MSYHNNQRYPAFRGKDVFISGCMIIVFLIVSGGYFYKDLNTEIKSIDIVNYLRIGISYDHAR